MRTPINDITKYDHLRAVDAITRAWVDPGVNPWYHHRMQNDLRHAMPLLARALDRQCGIPLTPIGY